MPLPGVTADTEVSTGQHEHLTYGPKGLDDLLREMNTPRQDFSPPETVITPGEPLPPGSTAPEIEAQPPMDRETAARQGERIARLVDGGVSIGTAWYAKAEKVEKYKASHGEMQDLTNAWTDIAMEYQVKINPWANLAFLNVMIYGPKLMQASTDRRFNILNDRMAAMEGKINKLKEMEAHLEAMEKQLETKKNGKK